MSTDTEQDQIIRQITSGDKRQLELATDLLRRRIKKTVTKIVRMGGDEEDINTLLNDTAVVLIAKIRAGIFDPSLSTLEGLAFAIVRNKWKDELKKRYKKHDFEDKYLVQVRTNGNGRQNPIELHLFTKEERENIVRALKQLDQSYRTLMEQKYLKGISLRVIAENLGISEDAAKKRHERGKKKLREILGRDPRIED